MIPKTLAEIIGDMDDAVKINNKDIQACHMRCADRFKSIKARCAAAGHFFGKWEEYSDFDGDFIAHACKGCGAEESFYKVDWKKQHHIFAYSTLGYYYPLEKVEDALTLGLDKLDQVVWVQERSKIYDFEDLQKLIESEKEK